MPPGTESSKVLEDEEVARVGCSCRFALDCLCTDMHELCHECVRTDEGDSDFHGCLHHHKSCLAPLHVLSPNHVSYDSPLKVACVHCFLDHITFPQAGVGLLYFFRETVVFAQSCASNQAHLRSHSGQGPVLSSIAQQDQNSRWNQSANWCFERLRLPLTITDATCECGVCLDLLGRHRAACPRSERLYTRCQQRGLWRECVVKLVCPCERQIMNVEVRAYDERATGVRASGLPHPPGRAVGCGHHGAFTPHPRQAWRAQGAATTDGAMLVRARADKEAKLHRAPPGKPMSFGGGGPGDGGQMEHRGNLWCRHVGGRSRARGPPPPVLAWRRRWMRMLAVSCGRSLADSLVSVKRDTWRGTERGEA